MLKMRLNSKAAMEDLRKRWTVAAELLANNQLARLKSELEEATPVDTGNAKASWRLVKFSKERYKIINDVPYIVFLNAGSSKQAPAFFVEAIALKYGRPKGTIVNYK